MEIKKILIPTDCSELSKDALRIGIDFAKKFDAKLLLLYVANDTSPIALEDLQGLPNEVAQNLRNAAGQRFQRQIEDFWNSLYDSEIKVELEVDTGDPFTQIIKVAKRSETDLIIMGTHGHTGIKHILMGSVAEKVVRYSPFPVLTVKHDEHDYEPYDK